VYSGPIGAVLTPLLDPSSKNRELADASSLCGACTEACPVKIPLHDMLVHQRRRNAEAAGATLTRSGFRAFAWLFSRPRVFAIASRVGRTVERALRRFPGSKWLERLPLLREWARHRALPSLAKRSFREQFRDLNQ
jgi:L-lactate dehydrogenase complex protein LldF